MKPIADYHHIHFVTGRLAEPALRRQVSALSQSIGFRYSIDVMPITVAALLNVNWVIPRLNVDPDADLVVLPGYCQGDLAHIQAAVSRDVIRGPKDLRQLPQFFGQTGSAPTLEQYDIQIIAEINHAPRLSLEELQLQAGQLLQQGADVIDIGCEPGMRFARVAEAVKAVRDLGARVSIDSMDIREISDAVSAGAELVLSVNADTCHAAVDWDAEVVVISREPADWQSLEQAVDFLDQHDCRFRIDPILEPIGLGFAQSLHRYYLARKQWPEAEIMMGVGNLTELTDVDSAGVNMMLLGFCQELSIRSVLTTQVINWARSSVSELAIARRLVHYACQQGIPPKRLSDQLVQLRDTTYEPQDVDELKRLAAAITDPNYRLFSLPDRIACLGDGQYWESNDPFQLFQQMQDAGQSNLNPSHAFYLGFEMAKAQIAQQLNKNYRQDQALDWGHLTQAEPDRHHLRSRRSTSQGSEP